MDIKNVIKAAVCAPSGDNCQPWRIIVEGRRIEVYNVPERDTSLFNFRQRASLVALGALVENILIASSALGCTARLNSFPDRTKPQLVASIDLEESSAKDEPLYPCIAKRTTNRKLYKPVPLTDKQKNCLFSATKDLDGKLLLADKPEEKLLLSKVAATNDRLAFENPHIHKFLFEHIRWTEKEARETGDGLEIRTLELSPPEAAGFRLLKHWPVVRVLTNLGLSQAVARQSRRHCLSASAIGCIVVNGNADQDFLTGGRLVQRVWLEATRLGLSFQPMTGITFLINRLMAGVTGGLTSEQIREVREDHDRLKSVFRLASDTVVMLFRTGFSDPPSARSLRLPLDKVVEGEAQER